MTELRELSVNDEFVRLLKSREIHNELLCELCTHPAFRDFLSDLEIYVDGIASIPIQKLNVATDLYRKTIVQRAGEKPELREDQQMLRMLEAAVVDEDEFFLHRLSKSLGIVAKDLRERHKGDPASAEGDMIAKEYNRDLQLADQIVQSRPDKKRMAKTLLEALSQGIHYPLSKFTEEEKEMLMGLFERSGAVKEGTRTIPRGRRRRKK